MADADFDDKNKKYEKLLSDYNSADAYSEKEKLYSQLSDAKKAAYDAEDIRRITIGATIAVWGLNLLDVILFFPEERGSMIVSPVSIRPDLQNGGALLTLTYKF
jgi:hypothetical protein